VYCGEGASGLTAWCCRFRRCPEAAPMRPHCKRRTGCQPLDWLLDATSASNVAVVPVAGLGAAGSFSAGSSSTAAASNSSLVGALLVLSPVHGEVDCGLLSLSADVAHALGGALHLRHMLAEYRAGEEILYVSGAHVAPCFLLARKRIAEGCLAEPNFDVGLSPCDRHEVMWLRRCSCRKGSLGSLFMGTHATRPFIHSSIHSSIQSVHASALTGRAALQRC
jgi:hypothetical protein